MTGLKVFPVSDHVICLYIQFLSSHFKSPDSVKQYVSGLRTIHKLLGMYFPSSDSIEIRLTIRGMSRLKQHVPRKAAPVTVELLKDIRSLLDLSSQHGATFWCLFCFMFFLLGRKSQFICDGVIEVKKLLVRRDVVVKEDHLCVTFRWSKTLQFGGEVWTFPLVHVPNSLVCPVFAYVNMIKVVRAPPDSVLFVIPGSKGHLKPIHYVQFTKVFRTLVLETGRKAEEYSSHSFRRGGATYAFECGVPDHYIRMLGGWRSDCYKGYVDVSFKERFKAATLMAECL